VKPHFLWHPLQWPWPVQNDSAVTTDVCEDQRSSVELLWNSLLLTCGPNGSSHHVLAVVRFRHRPPARPLQIHKPTDRTYYNTLHRS